MPYPGANGYRPINRLNRLEDFKEVFSSKQRSTDKQFLFIVKDNDQGFPRLGLAVPKRHIAKSVMRNRVKRVIREGFRRKKQQLGARDIVVLVHNPLQEINQKSFDLSLAKHLQKIGICDPCDPFS